MPSDLPPSQQTRTAYAITVTRRRCKTSLAGVMLAVMAATLVWSHPGGNEATAATLKPGDILVVDILMGVIRIDPATGAQTVVTTGGYLNSISNSAGGIALEANGQILVIDIEIAMPDGSSVPGIVRVDPATGLQSLVTTGDLLYTPFDIAVEANGQIVVTDRAGIIRVDPVTGAQTLVTSGGNLSGPRGITVVFKKPK
jgi:sugar lactone lactonase YvrE